MFYSLVYPSKTIQAFQAEMGPYKSAPIAALPLLRLRHVNQKTAKIYYIKCKSQCCNRRKCRNRIYCGPFLLRQPHQLPHQSEFRRNRSAFIRCRQIIIPSLPTDLCIYCSRILSEKLFYSTMFYMLSILFKISLSKIFGAEQRLEIGLEFSFFVFSPFLTLEQFCCWESNGLALKAETNLYPLYKMISCLLFLV